MREIPMDGGGGSPAAKLVAWYESPTRSRGKGFIKKAFQTVQEIKCYPYWLLEYKSRWKHSWEVGRRCWSPQAKLLQRTVPTTFSSIALCSWIFHTAILSIFLFHVKFPLHRVSGGTLVWSGVVGSLHGCCQLCHGAQCCPVQLADLTAFLLEWGYSW